MKKRALLLLAACAVLFASNPVFAAEITCAEWLGDWTFTYAGGVTDDVSITDICDNPTNASLPCLPVKDGSPQTYWNCIARGTRTLNNQVIQIRKIMFDTTVFAYYEATDAELITGGQATPNATIPNSAYNSDCQKFTVSKKTAPIDLESGQKKGAPACPDCQLANIIPGTINAFSLIDPLAVFVIIGPSTNEFAPGATADFKDKGIHSLAQLRITPTLIIAICWIDWYGTAPGSSDVTVGTCTGSITIN